MKSHPSLQIHTPETVIFLFHYSVLAHLVAAFNQFERKAALNLAEEIMVVQFLLPSMG